MDLLFTRYADPFSFMDGCIATARFSDFIDMVSQQQMEDNRWEFFLHKVWDKSYDEFRSEMQVSQDLQRMSDDAMEATVERSMQILGNFVPNTDGGGP